ncbi:hypothetical protein [Nocardiopsis halotolerans]|uniref:hypothetical protein n=1 Tax=Nocardiopsis halotolerans TaxID=124252 RepID=UPI000344E7F8|nr:hypothetical protein [Nocardiopsis halotolerans]
MPFSPSPRSVHLPLGSLTSLALVFTLSACGDEGGEPAAEAAAPSTPEESAESAPTGDIPEEELAGLLVEAPVPSSRPQADLSALPPEPEDAPISEQVAWFLLTEVSEKASHVDPDASAECPEEMREVAGRSHTCTLTYGGLTMEFPVSSTEDGGDVAFRFEYPELPTVRQVVEDTIRFDHGVEAVYCDMEDVVAVVPGGDRAPYLCYAMDGGPEWVDAPSTTISPYEVHVLIGGTLATYQYLEE